MNSPESPSTPRTCRWVRRWDAYAAGSTGESRIARRHRENCPECEILFTGDDVFEQALRRDARAAQRQAPAGLERRILRAQAEAARPARAFSWTGAGLALAGAAAVAVVAFFVAIRPDMPPGARSNLAAEGTAPAGGERPAQVTSWRALTEPARQWVEQNPLEQELVSLTTNARSVLGFLAMNFLPSEEDVSGATGERDSAGANRG